MPRLPHTETWRPARDVPFLLVLVAVAACMVRTVDQPEVSFELAGTELSLVPADLALAALGAACVLRLLGRAALPSPARATTAAATAFFGWLVLTSAANGAEALVGALRLLEYGILALGAVLFVRRRVQLWTLATLLVAVTVVGTADVAIDWLRQPGRRHGGFLGAHDFSALATMSLTLALAGLYAREPRRRLSLVAGVAGALGLVIAAALASLIGFYLAVVALVAIAWTRSAVTRRALALTALVAVAVTAGVIGQRVGDIGFVHELGDDEPDAGATASGWSQRLVYAYVGGRVFLDNPVLGTGWHGELPPEEYARYLPDARRRFPDQPAHYFPAADGRFVPQQTYDQVLMELGVVGGALFLVLAAAAIRTVLRAGAGWPSGAADEQLAYLPAAWLASLAGALAGAALFGGIPLTAVFWLTLGVVALTPGLAPPPRVPRPPEEAREPALAVG